LINKRNICVFDNLIHPVVYKDAQITGNSFDFKPMYQPVKKDIQNADISFVNQESRMIVCTVYKIKASIY
jgi:hypothetical protein